jgi:SAM-dependent methyltransferase
VLFLSDLDPEAVGDAGAHATHYEPVPIADFRELMTHVPADVVRGSTFVDVGSGMGRAVLLASAYPFKQVVGVEVSPGLHEVARENLERARIPQKHCRDVRLVRADARIWQYPPGDLVVFLFNPFDAEAMHVTLNNVIHRRSSGETWLLYHTPVERAVIENENAWQMISETRSGVVYRFTKTKR